MEAPEFVLKSTPPRAHRMALFRPRLQRLWEEVNDRTAVAVCAPSGFGKTTLLVQWRRLWLERGALVAWVTLDAEDDPPRLAQVLLHALRTATGRGVFATLAQQAATQTGREFDVLTDLLSEIVALATPTVVMLDDAERLPEATIRESLSYLLYNAPPNLHLVIGSRTPLPLPSWDLAAHGNFATLKADDLRLDVDESNAILERRFGPRIRLEDCVRLYEITEGWPIGLALAAATNERESDLPAAIAALSGRRGDIEQYFLASLFARMDANLLDFLTRIAILEHLTPPLCDAVIGRADAAALLDELTGTTPVVLASEFKDWIRLHPLARDFLLARFERLPRAEQQSLHRRAADWFSEHGRFHEAAHHALGAGDEPLAQSYAARCLWTLATRGKLVEAAAWLERIPESTLGKDVGLHLVAAWILALSDRTAEARRIAEPIALDQAAEPSKRFVAALVATAAAAYADRLGAIDALLEPWPELPERVDNPVHRIAYANTRALVALHSGDTERVRRLETNLSPAADGESLELAVGIGRLFVGWSHLWDGDTYKAEAMFRPALAQAERQAGRRSIVASQFAAGLAVTLLERNEPAAAQALLAHRLDVLERNGAPDTVLLAYGTLAGVAVCQGDERRALDVLDRLHALGTARGIPRYLMASLAARVRLHALHSRNETVSSLARELDELGMTFGTDDYRLFLPQHELVVAIAQAYAALARVDYDASGEVLLRADVLAARLHRGRDALTIKVLRAVVAESRRRGEGRALLSEALSLASLGGFDRLLADTHPIAVQMGGELRAAPLPAPEVALQKPVGPRAPVVPQGGLLTPKEAEVLQLLTTGLSNKLIARTMDISDETVKWHLKNLFSKLSAGTRKHAVDRARMLGLVAT